MILGYARVSTLDQDLAAQIESLTKAGAERIYQEKISGKNAERPELQRMLCDIRERDVIVVTRLDRLARSTIDLLTILETVHARGATFKAITDAWADFTTPHGKLILTVMGAFAQWERELIKARTDEGRRRAKAEGRSIGGPKPKLNAFQRVQGLERLNAGERPEAIAQDYGVSSGTIRKLRNAA